MSNFSFVLYQPDIPQNAGNILRTAACFGLSVDVIDPAGFPWDDKRLRRAGMDYLTDLKITRHASFQEYRAGHTGRLIALTTKAASVYTEVSYQPGDAFILGQESSGLPQSVHEAVDLRVRIPLEPHCRSLNVTVAAAIVASEARRQARTTHTLFSNR